MVDGFEGILAISFKYFSRSPTMVNIFIKNDMSHLRFAIF